MSDHPVWLVARREVAARVRERSFAISTAITVLVLAALLVIPALSGGDDAAEVVAAPGPSRELAQAAVAVGRAAGEDLEVVEAGGDAEARRQVRDGDADVAVLAQGTRVAQAKDAPDAAVAAVQGASRAQRAQAALAQAGITGDRARAVLAPAPLPVADFGQDDDAARGLAFVALLLLYGQLLTYGYWVAFGVVEEKASRVVEILLSTIRPRELLAGKVLGIGSVALGQLLAVGVVGLGLGVALGQLDLGATELGALAVTLGFFVLGYAFYACAFAIAGALVPRQEEVQNATAPLTLCILGAFFLATTALRAPDGGLAVVLSFVPPSAPLVMPVRVIAGDVAGWQIALSVLLTLVGAAALVTLAGRVYGTAVLRTGQRIGLRAALAASRG